MIENKYLEWLSQQTDSTWWHDSAIVDELDTAIKNGAVGVTTNPFLVRSSLVTQPKFWNPMLKDLSDSMTPSQRAEEIVRAITSYLAVKFTKTYKESHGVSGYACAQVNPAKAGDADVMLSMARRLSKWAPNIAVKLPVTAAGLDVLEECIAEGITITGTASFTVPQALAIGARHMKGIERAKKNGIKPGHCFAVVMVGRLDDYLRDVAHDRKSTVQESDIIQAGTAVIKRAYSIFNERGYQAVLMPAALRGPYHLTAISGAKMAISIAPKTAAMVCDEEHTTHIAESVSPEVIKRLMTISEFARAYELDGMKPEEFITFGAEQRTLSQFVEAGWSILENYKI
jgi:transaldolase